MPTVFIESLLLALLICSSSGDGANKGYVACLPADVELEEVVSAPEPRSNTATASKPSTVRGALSRLKARCRKGKLVAGNGREIRLYRLIGCWGNPPDDYQEQLARQNKELERLKKKYTVVEIPCDQNDPRQIH